MHIKHLTSAICESIG